MNAANANLQTRKKPNTSQISVLRPPHSNLLQRKCTCGGTPGPSGECEECRKNRLNVQRRAAHETESATVDRALYAMPDSTSRPAYNFATVPVHARSPLSIQTKLAVSQPGDQDEQEADRAAEQLMRAEARAASDRNEPPRLSAAEPRVQRQAVDEAPASPAETVEAPAPATPETTPEPATPSETPTAGLLVDDEATELGPGQVKKSEFLDGLRAAVCAAADAELAAVGRSTDGCPYIEYWIGYYRTRDSAYIERAIRKYAPETAGVTTARDYIPLITERMRQGVATWAMTGQITGVPEELASLAPGAGGMLAGAASAASSVVSGMAGLLFKARNGGPRDADPQEIRSQLRSGSPLDGGMKARMETAFGHDFSRVRVHADGQAANLSSSLNARAFTVGSDIAFGSGEYQPGTLIGDALLAHELAHVVQQGGTASSGPLQKGDATYNALEEDADTSAVGAVVSLWGGAKGALANIAQNAIPRLKSGLGLQRCSKTTQAAVPHLTKSTVSGPTAGDCDTYSWGIQWSLDNPGSSNGWIVQKVQDIFEVTDCAGTALTNADIKTRSGIDPSIFPYWEAWQVRSGTVYIGGTTSPHHADTYNLTGVTGDTKGKERIIGDAEFYNGLTLPSSFAVRPNHPAGALPVAISQPTLPGGTGAISHNLTATWDCCPGAASRLTKLTTS